MQNWKKLEATRKVVEEKIISKSQREEEYIKKQQQQYPRTKINKSELKVKDMEGKNK